LLSLTTGGPEGAYTADGFNGDVSSILRPIHRGILQFVGYDVLRPEIVWAPVRITDEERGTRLATWAQRLHQIEREEPIDVGRY
jgi:NAD(P)H dehydrogenase (quinone)